MTEDFDVSELAGEAHSDPEAKETFSVKKTLSLTANKEEMILSYLAANPNLYVRAKPLLKSAWFSGNHGEVAKFLLEYFTTHKSLPSQLAIRGKTGVELDRPSDAHEPQVMRFIADEVEAFCRDNSLNDFLSDAVDDQSQRGGEPRTVEEMAILHQRMQELSRISMTTDLGSEVYRDYKPKLAKAKESQGIRTGFAFLDEALGGGVTRPSFNIMSAGTGDGKSIMMVNALINYSTMHKEDVVYYTLENSEEMTHQRMIAIMTELNIRGLWSQMDRVDLKMFDLKKQGGGRIFVKRFPIQGTTMSKIDAHFHELQFRENCKIRCMAIDYLDVMSPTNDKIARDNISVRDAEIAQEVYDFTHTNDLILWSASQQTKGSDKEKEAHRGNVSGGTHKINTADLLLIGKRNEDDELNSMIWWHVKKTRNSGAINAAIPMYWDQASQKQYNRPEDRELFEEQNPKIFGRKQRSRIQRDPVAKEMVEMGAMAAESPLASRMTAMGIKRKARV